MKIIFLDVDGVLNNAASIAMGVHLVAEKVMMVNDLAVATGSNIVISSSWRGGWELKDLKEILRICGFRRSDLIGGYTPRGHGFTCRGEEIKSVLDANDVEAYVILDDDADMLAEQQDNFVKTRFELGLTHREIKRAKQILGVVDDEPAVE